MMRIAPAADAAHAHQVEGGKAQQRLPRELGLTNQFGLGQTAHRLDPAKGFLDALAYLLAGLVTLVPLDATIHRRVLVLGRHVRRDFDVAATWSWSWTPLRADPFTLTIGPSCPATQLELSAGSYVDGFHRLIHVAPSSP